MSRRRKRSPGLVALLVALAGWSRPAAAEPDSEAASRALFEEGRRLIRDGDYVNGCPKLEAAARVYRSPGVLLNLGDCYERANRTATAWGLFVEAEAVSTRAARSDMQAEAARRKQELDPKLVRVALRVAEDLPGLQIDCDGLPVSGAALQRPLVVDPGRHVVKAAAPGRVPWSVAIEVSEPGLVAVDVPGLARASEAPAPVHPPERDVFSWTAPRAVGAALTGVGVLGMGAGAVLALVARGRENDAENETGTARAADSDTAVREGNVATAFAVGGAVMTVAGIVVWLTAPRTPVVASAGGRRFVLQGAF